MVKKLNKHTARLFASKKVEPKGSEIRELDSVRFTDCRELLEECRQMYDSLQTARATALRCINYTFGRQWNDRIQDPDGLYYGQTIREEDYIKRQGKVPLKYNIMNKSKKSIVGLYRQNKSEPVAIAHDRDEQKLGEMMTIAMQYAYNINNVYELNARLLEYAFCSGIFIRSCYYKPIPERQMSDVYVQNENLFQMFFNADVQDVLLRDITTIGAIRDLSVKELIAAFAHNEKEARQLVNEYSGVLRSQSSTLDTFDHNRYGTESDFYTPRDVNKCRVYEVWRKETERCFYCHDTAEGTEMYRPLSEQMEIEEENARRQQEMLELGYDPSNASLINYEWAVREYWYVRYLTPTGKCIKESESPFEHGSHPFTIGAYPLINGEIHSPAEDLIDIQRVINRTLSQIDFIRQNSAKGVLMCPTTAIPDWMTPEQFAKEYTKDGGVIFYTPDPAVKDIPQQIKSSSVVAGDIDVVRLYMQLNDEISGINGALQGQKAASGTPASLYAQEAQNSSINIADFMSWFNSCVQSADNKMMKVMQQYYDDVRYIPIAGKNFSQTSKWYNPDKIRQSEFDITISEATSTPAYRMAMEDTLLKALEMNMLDFKTYLEASSAPFADSLLEIIKRNEQQAQEQQAAAGDMNQQLQAALMQQQAMQQAQQ